MKRVFYLIFAATISISAVAETPIEAGAIVDKSVYKTPQLLEVLVSKVRINGYKCDSVSYASRMAYNPGFILGCNKSRYKYEIEDKGGKWQVTLE
jgi:hypothetical protein